MLKSAFAFQLKTETVKRDGKEIRIWWTECRRKSNMECTANKFQRLYDFKISQT